MKIIIESPTKAYLDFYTDDELEALKNALSYKNLSAQHQLKRLSKNFRFKNSNPFKYQQQYDLLKSQINQCLVFDDGRLFIRPGSIPYLSELNIEIENWVNYPKPRKVGWFRKLPFNLHYYQEESAPKLIENKHANVSITTSGGKSAIILKLYADTGFKCAIVAPSRAIFNELAEKFEHHFGKGNVGKFGDGKKKIGKPITICVDDSLVNIEKDSEEWKFFSSLQMLVWDESHTTASNTLEAVCNGLFSEVPYRFFMSATQVRNDGGLKLLQSIIGKEVYKLTTEEAVNGGFICPHQFKIVQLQPSNPNFTSSDALEIKRECFLRDKNITSFVAKLANMFTSKNEQTLILCEELSQIATLNKLIPNLGYAHSESNKQKLETLGLQKVDVSEQIEKFNRNEIKVLAGTSCLHVGVNIFPMTNTINWIGGSSEIKTRQAAIGRSVRLASANPYKNLCGLKESVTIWDFDIVGNYVLERHLEERIGHYADSGPGLIKYVKFK